jgi:exonuclease SbcD
VRIAHTSDWHLGRSFGEVSLRDDQARFCDWFVELVREEACELVVIAGDIYDRAIAPTESIDLFRDTVRRLLAARIKVVAITGNHDAADRVAAYSELLDLSGLLLRGGYDRIGEVIPFPASDGPLDLVLLPFLHPQIAPDDFGTDPSAGDDAEQGDSADGNVDALLRRRSRRSHESVLADAVELARPQLTSGRSLAVAHAFVAGGEESESERRLEVGGTGQVGAELFSGFSYTALGHLHRPQDVPVDGGRVRYSGTPLPYSFSEDHPKSVTIVDLATDGTCTVEKVPVPVGRAVHRISGTMDELLEAGRFPHAHNGFVQATVTDRETVTDAKAKLLDVYPYVVEVRLAPLADGHERAAAPENIREVPPLQAVSSFWEAAEGAPPTGAVLDLLTDVVATSVRAVEQ